MVKEGIIDPTKVVRSALQNAASVATALRTAGLSTLLHGHTHRPAVHRFEVDGRACTRIVLGDWHAQGSVLRWDEEGQELLALPRSGTPE